MKVTLNLDTPEHHPTSGMPRAVRDLWYGRRGDSLTDLIDAQGCPNSGCEHKFHFSAERGEVVAWLDLFEETYPNTAPEVAILKRQIKRAVVYNEGVDSNGNVKVTLKKITRQVPFNGEMIERPWFWTEDWEKENA